MNHFKRLSLIMLAIALGLGLLLAGLWQVFKAHQHIHTFSASGWAFSSQGLSLDTLLIKRGASSAPQTLNAQKLKLSWQRLSIERLALVLPALPANNIQQPSPPLIEDLSQWVPSWLPKQVQINQLLVELPCQLQRCTLDGSLQAYIDASQQLIGRLQLKHLEHALALTLKADLRRISSFDAALSVNAEPKAHLTNQLLDGLWQGQLTLAPLPEFAWLLPWLNQWVTGLESLPALPIADARLTWQLTPPAHFDWPSLQRSEGRLTIDADILQDWQLAELGKVKGPIAVALTRAQNRLTVHTLKAQLSLNPVGTPWLEQVPQHVRATRIMLELKERSQTLENALALDATLNVEGPLTGSLQGPLELYLNTPKPYAELSNAELTMALKRLKTDAINARDIALKAKLQGEFGLDYVSLQSQGPLTLRAQELAFTDFSAQAISLNLKPKAAQFMWQDGALSYSAQGTLEAAARLKQPQLKTANWQWPARFTLTSDAVTLDGPLSNSHQLTVQTQLTHTFAGGTNITAHMANTHFARNNPLKSSLSAWPSNVDILSGTATLEASLKLPLKGAADLQLNGTLENLAGVYETTEFAGLSGPLKVSLQNQTISLASPALKVRQINSGIGMGPATLSAQYQTSIQQFAKGELDVQRFASDFLGGRVWLEPQRIHLSRANPKATVQIAGVKIESLLAAYPAEGLAGTGTLDGQLPVILTEDGVAIEQGLVRAREPGGRLQFQSDKLTALGQTNPAMQLAADALSDFRFHTLKSGVSLTPQGTLNLAFTLEGSNPDLQKGRPINFNIQLEEDLPALFKSLQLSGKVSERIEQRVRQQLNAPH